VIRVFPTAASAPKVITGLLVTGSSSCLIVHDDFPNIDCFLGCTRAQAVARHRLSRCMQNDRTVHTQLRSPTRTEKRGATHGHTRKNRQKQKNTRRVAEVNMPLQHCGVSQHRARLKNHFSKNRVEKKPGLQLKFRVLGQGLEALFWQKWRLSVPPLRKIRRVKGG
jgi:hypothetical protein